MREVADQVLPGTCISHQVTVSRCIQHMEGGFQIDGDSCHRCLETSPKQDQFQIADAKTFQHLAT